MVLAAQGVLAAQVVLAVPEVRYSVAQAAQAALAEPEVLEVLAEPEVLAAQPVRQAPIARFSPAP